MKGFVRVLTKRERRKAGEDMETVSCKRKKMHIRAVIQKYTKRLKKKENNANRKAEASFKRSTQKTVLHTLGGVL